MIMYCTCNISHKSCLWFSYFYIFFLCNFWPRGSFAPFSCTCFESVSQSFPEKVRPPSNLKVIHWYLKLWNMFKRFGFPVIFTKGSNLIKNDQDKQNEISIFIEFWLEKWRRGRHNHWFESIIDWSTALKYQ